MQKNLFYRYFTILMAALVLSSSIGVGLVESHCMMRGKSVELVFKEKKKSCKLCRSTSGKKAAPPAQQETPVFKKLHCCVEKQQLKAVDFQVPIAKKLEKPAKDLTDGHFPGIDLVFLKHNLSDTGDTSPAAVVSFSSPYSGRSMIAFVQSFLI